MTMDTGRAQRPGYLQRIRTATVLAALALLAGCSGLPQPGTQPEQTAPTGKTETPVAPEKVALPSGVFTGEVLYRERIALLPKSFVRVVLEREARQAEPPLEIAEQIFHPAGQVPFRYRLNFDPDTIQGGFRYRLKGQIFSQDERLLFASETPLTVDPLGADRRQNLLLKKVPLTHQRYMKPVTAAVSRVFQCGDFTFATRTGIGEIALYLPDNFLVLSQISSASGVRYQEGDTLFWMKGEQAMLSYQGVFYRQCLRNTRREARDPVERRPVDFRALGHEPPWLLEVVGDHNINLITDYGQQRIQLPEPVREAQDGQVRYRAKDAANRLAVTVTEKRCQDTMSDELWPQQVSVWWNSRHFTGCGRFLTGP